MIFLNGFGFGIGSLQNPCRVLLSNTPCEQVDDVDISEGAPLASFRYLQRGLIPPPLNDPTISGP